MTCTVSPDAVRLSACLRIAGWRASSGKFFISECARFLLTPILAARTCFVDTLSVPVIRLPSIGNMPLPGL